MEHDTRSVVIGDLTQSVNHVSVFHVSHLVTLLPVSSNDCDPPWGIRCQHFFRGHYIPINHGHSLGHIGGNVWRNIGRNSSHFLSFSFLRFLDIFICRNRIAGFGGIKGIGDDHVYRWSLTGIDEQGRKVSDNQTAIGLRPAIVALESLQSDPRSPIFIGQVNVGIHSIAGGFGERVRLRNSGLQLFDLIGHSPRSISSSSSRVLLGFRLGLYLAQGLSEGIFAIFQGASSSNGGAFGGISSFYGSSSLSPRITRVEDHCYERGDLDTYRGDLDPYHWISPELPEAITMHKAIKAAKEFALSVIGLLCVLLGYYLIVAVLPDQRTIWRVLVAGLFGLFLLFFAQWIIGCFLNMVQ